MKDAIPVGIGITFGLLVAPRALNALGIAASEGFGTDDLVTIGICTASVILAYRFF